MPPTGRPERRFSDSETQLILRRAAELHESAPEPGTSGLDRSQLEQVAAEVGIAPAAVRRAIAELEAKASDPGPEGFVTGRLRRIVFDAPLARPPERDPLPHLAGILETALGAEGEVETTADALIWRLPGLYREIRVSLRPRPGGGAVRVEESLGRLGGSLFGGVVGGLGGGLGGSTAALVAVGLGSPAAAGILVVGALGGSYWWAKRLFLAEARRRRFQLAIVAQVLADAADDLAR
ncbi:MAG TPA: hypothetical protein VG500_00565 [Gemmatimonadales bacterium]|jgi:hypothetical protein|nr:hypothetical protein [Gemmatimonadales bacterium]